MSAEVVEDPTVEQTGGRAARPSLSFPTHDSESSSSPPQTIPVPTTTSYVDTTAPPPAPLSEPAPAPAPLSEPAPAPAPLSEPAPAPAPELVPAPAPELVPAPAPAPASAPSDTTVRKRIKEVDAPHPGCGILLYTLLLAMIVAWIIYSIVVIVNTWASLSVCPVGCAGLGVMVAAPLMVPLDIVYVALLCEEMRQPRPTRPWDPQDASCCLPMMVNTVAAVLSAPFFAFMGFQPARMTACPAPDEPEGGDAATAPPLAVPARVIVHVMVWVALLTLATYLTWQRRLRQLQRRRNSGAQPLLVVLPNGDRDAESRR